MSKERKDAWVAVAPEFATNSGGEAVVAPPVSAYQFFQREMTQVIKRELMQQSNGKVDVGYLTKAVAERWKQLPPSGKIKFENKAREDRTRYARESHARDVARLQRQEQLRKEREVGILADGERRTRRTILPEPTKTNNTANNTPKTTISSSRTRQRAKKKLDDDNDEDDDSFHQEESDDDSSSVESSDYGSDDDDAQQSDNSEGGSSSSSSSSSEEEEDDDSTGRSKRSSPTKKQQNDKRQKRVTTSRNSGRATAASTAAARLREEREQYVMDRQEKLRKERADQAKRRLEFLLQQSDIFSHFGGVQHESTKLKSRSTTKNTKTETANDTASRGAGNDVANMTEPKEEVERDTTTTATCVHRDSSSHKPTAAVAEDDEEQDLINPETTLTTYLTSQPSDLGFGMMRDYQLEGLNWMIRLQENGVNGILAG
jgi:hypothetical protein